MSPKGKPSGSQPDRNMEALSSAVEKVEAKEAEKDLPAGGGAGRRVHEAFRENA